MASVSLPDLIRAIRGQIPNEKCDLLEDLVQKLQQRELRLNRQEFLHRVKDIAGDDAPALRMALKQLAVERRGAGADAQGSMLLDTGIAEPPFEASLLSVANSSHDAAPNNVPEADPLPDGAQEQGPASNADQAGTSMCAADATRDRSSDGQTHDVEVADHANSVLAPVEADVPTTSAAKVTAAQPATAAPQQQQQRLEVAAAAVLVHAAGCKSANCPVPHCNKMRKIHTHFLECSLADCAICKKLKPLTFIHAKHCVSEPGEQCVIPYCARAKRELQVLMQRRGGYPACSDDTRNILNPHAGLSVAASAALPSLASASSAVSCSNGALADVAPAVALETMSTQAQAHYLLVLAHVMKCPSANCTVPECAPTKALVTNHTRSCRAGDTCSYPRCALSKRLMRHHRECPDQSCAICLPLRRRLAAAKVGVSAASTSDHAVQQPRRKPAKRKKEEEETVSDALAKKKRKDGISTVAPREVRGNSKKRGATLHADAQEPPEAQQIVAEHDVLESGFCVSVHFVTGKRPAPGDEMRGDWRSGIVMRAYKTVNDDEMVYDVMMAEGKEEKAVAHARCRMVCYVCLSDKRAFRPPPMFCEKCFTAIHQRWSYWEEGGDDGGLKLCKRCYADIKASAHPNRILADLAHRNNLQIDLFIEKKEKDRPEYVDNWVQCDECHAWMHWTCGLYKGEDTPDDCLFFCDNCRLTRGKALAAELTVPPAAKLAEDSLSISLQASLRKELGQLGVQCAPVTIRVVSNVDSVTKFEHTSVIGGQGTHVASDKGQRVLGKAFPYRSKCILAFQHVDGQEVCFFAMYVQEYGSDCPEPNTNRVYISYLDSVRYFRSQPDGHRTTIYHSVLVNYLAYARELGFTHAHIWVSPPKQGDDYIFYAHPETMVTKRMGLLKLKEWYEKMLEVAKARGIVVDYQDMQEEYKDIESIDDIPMFSGDHWAASIVKKMEEQRRKEDATQMKKKHSSPASAVTEISGVLPLGSEPPRGGGEPSAGGKVALENKDDQLLNQITEEMRSMRNHFIVVTLVELKKQFSRAVIRDPVPLISNEFVDTRSAFLEKCQMYHWQFDELRNAQHSTLMLLYHLHGMHKAAKTKLASQHAMHTEPHQQQLRNATERKPLQAATSRSSKIETAMHDWSTLLAHANEAAAMQTWALPPDELFQRILAQINRSKRDILQEKYSACLSPTCSEQTRAVFIRVLKRIAESFMTWCAFARVSVWCFLVSHFCSCWLLMYHSLLQMQQSGGSAPSRSMIDASTRTAH
mmetsp:Transcript_30805/g.80137  ORF Transcript_30805/g.80137 Transcript_30805/m.80137 type:complete len:1263 (+) Transcript_30805:33-3821(+)